MTIAEWAMATPWKRDTTLSNSKWENVCYEVLQGYVHIKIAKCLIKLSFVVCVACALCKPVATSCLYPDITLLLAGIPNQC